MSALEKGLINVVAHIILPCFATYPDSTTHFALALNWVSTVNMPFQSTPETWDETNTA